MSLTGRLDGKVAVVTASTEGIGLAIARRLGQEGAAIVISSRKKGNVDKAIKTLKSEKLKVSGITCHQGKKEDRTKLIDHAIETFGGIDILVANAAVMFPVGPLLKIFDVNVKSTFFLCKEVVPHMQKRGGGSVILVSSIGGYIVPEDLDPYLISKTAVLGMTKALAQQCARINIRVNAIAPGLIRTKSTKRFWALTEAIQQEILMQRLGEPEECAGAVAFLASSDASYITGECIVMAGGKYSRL